MFSIHLDKMKFFAHHGLHDEEGITGTEFEVQVNISFDAEKVESLHDTVNYVTVYEIVKQKFLHPARLLETLAQDIVAEIRKTDVRIMSINITIHKINPPICNFTGSVGVSFSKSFS